MKYFIDVFMKKRNDPDAPDMDLTLLSDPVRLKTALLNYIDPFNIIGEVYSSQPLSPKKPPVPAGATVREQYDADRNWQYSNPERNAYFKGPYKLWEDKYNKILAGIITDEKFDRDKYDSLFFIEDHSYHKGGGARMSIFYLNAYLCKKENGIVWNWISFEKILNFYRIIYWIDVKAYPKNATYTNFYDMYYLLKSEKPYVFKTYQAAKFRDVPAESNDCYKKNDVFSEFYTKFMDIFKAYEGDMYKDSIGNGENKKLLDTINASEKPMDADNMGNADYTAYKKAVSDNLNSLISPFLSAALRPKNYKNILQIYYPPVDNYDPPVSDKDKDKKLVDNINNRINNSYIHSELLRKYIKDAWDEYNKSKEAPAEPPNVEPPNVEPPTAEPPTADTEGVYIELVANDAEVNDAAVNDALNSLSELNEQSEQPGGSRRRRHKPKKTQKHKKPKKKRQSRKHKKRKTKKHYRRRH